MAAGSVSFRSVTTYHAAFKDAATAPRGAIKLEVLESQASETDAVRSLKTFLAHLVSLIIVLVIEKQAV